MISISLKAWENVNIIRFITYLQFFVFLHPMTQIDCYHFAVVYSTSLFLSEMTDTTSLFVSPNKDTNIKSFYKPLIYWRKGDTIFLMKIDDTFRDSFDFNFVNGFEWNVILSLLCHIKLDILFHFTNVYYLK